MLAQDVPLPGLTPKAEHMLVNRFIRLVLPPGLLAPEPHSSPPLMMTVVIPKVAVLPAAESDEEGVQPPVMTAWQAGLGL